MSDAGPTAPAKQTREGAIPALATPEDRRAAMDQAFDYRGDVTIHTADGRVIQGFVYDRRSDGPEPFVRIMPSATNDRLRIPYAQIERLVFSGRDTAAGKSWETWLKKYQEKRAAGEKASIESEPLEG